MARPTHLIVVCCHGIWLGGPSGGADEAEWLIAPFQRGETATFAAHARAGVRRLVEGGDDAVLVFSGGPTRSETRLSEARSYAALAARHVEWWRREGEGGDDDADDADDADDDDDDVEDDDDNNNNTAAAAAAVALAQGRLLLEERALDSYHNVLFSLTLFHARLGTWPRALTLVSHGFKRPRLEAHCAAIGFPAARVVHVGIDPPAVPRRAAAAAEDQWRADPHGRAEALAAKRAARNPWAVWQGVFGQGWCRGRGGGLVTRGEGGGETLVEEAPRPWI